MAQFYFFSKYIHIYSSKFIHKNKTNEAFCEITKEVILVMADTIFIRFLGQYMRNDPSLLITQPLNRVT